MSERSKVTVTDSWGITVMNRHSVQHGYNRNLNSTAINGLDDHGVHVLSFSMMHEHAAGVRVDPHIRGQWMLKMDGRDEAVEVFLDMTMKDFNQFTTTYEVEVNPKTGRWEPVDPQPEPDPLTGRLPIQHLPEDAGQAEGVTQ